MSAVRAIGRFLYDFVIGDDWRIAAGVVASLAVGLALLFLPVPPALAVIGCAALVAASFAGTVVVTARQGRR